MSDEHLDAKIDEIAREMTRGEPPPDFRARLIARLETGHDRTWIWRPAWVMAPLAVAGVVLLAVLVVGTPWRSGRAVTGIDPFVVQDSSPTRPERIPDPTGKGEPTPFVGSDLGRIVSAERQTSAARLTPDAAYEGEAGRSGLAGDLATAPIAIESLGVEAMESTEVLPLTVDAMESIEVPRLSVAPLEVPAIGEQ